MTSVHIVIFKSANVSVQIFRIDIVHCVDSTSPISLLHQRICLFLPFVVFSLFFLQANVTEWPLRKPPARLKKLQLKKEAKAFTTNDLEEKVRAVEMHKKVPELLCHCVLPAEMSPRRPFLSAA